MDFPHIHEKWRKYWADNNVNAFNPKSDKPKYYSLNMFPYPSGASLHMGHFFNFAPADTHARFKRMCGFEVLQPMGFDAFGLPAENHALKTGTHPSDNTIKNMEIMVRQLNELGGMYDWNFSYATCFPDYYKWTQWLFLKLYNAGMAFQKEAPVNWCDKCKTVLANEQVVNNTCERCDTPVVRKNMKQWFFKITDYADRLLDGLEKLDWPNKTKMMQRNWIGKSTGETIDFAIVAGSCGSTSNMADARTPAVAVFTTRPDTILGVTFMVIAPEHADVATFITPDHKHECEKYIHAASKKSEIDRQEQKDKTGVFTGSYVTNPITKEQIPVWIADYVLANYGTGAVMGVPAYDDRDREFALAHKLPVNNAEFYKKPVGKPTTTYRLRDWGFSRQRYWGCPIPIVYCPHCGTVAVPEKDLPVKLPYITDFKPKGSAPLAAHPEFYECKCPKCGANATRECDTMDTFVCSSWYFLRYPYAHEPNFPFKPDVLRVNKYVGGAEHSCMHLLYARFINMFLHDQKLVNFAEPFQSLIHQGMILAPDGAKMSKSKGNTITPDQYVDKYGSDILRLYMLFGFNYADGGPWNDETLTAILKFVERVNSVVDITCAKTCAPTEELLHVEATTIEAVRRDLDTFSFNTAVARCMEFLNAIQKCPTPNAVRTLVLLLAPMMPHIAEELWERLSTKGSPHKSIFFENYPIADKKHLTRAEIEIAVQINSKIVARITVPTNATQAAVEKLCAPHLGGKTPKKVVFVPARLINFIIQS